jgi:hypothetical protein
VLVRRCHSTDVLQEPRAEDALELLGSPPKDEYALLEFALDWPGLGGVEAQLAAALRLFVITRDRLDWLADRGCAWATANADGERLELPVYITRDELERRIDASNGHLHTALGAVGEAVLAAATQCQGSIFAGARSELLHTITSHQALAMLNVGDRVQINRRASPRYLHGVHGVVVELDHHTAVVRVPRPIGRFKSGEIRCPPLALDRLSSAA